MRELLILIAVTFAIIGSVPASAQTPDGQTPAEETVCDPLIGATPGLYGLCVAYCEAHDADILSPYGEPAQLDVPNRMILQNYNSKKADFDPPMPCVQQAEGESCPCWTAGQLLTILPPSMNIDVNFDNACFNDPSQSTLALLENFENGRFQSPGIQLSTDLPSFEEFCQITNDGYPGGPPTNILHVTGEEYESCRSLLAAHAYANMVAGHVWDCFAE